MAYDKVVDSAALDADLTSVADAIRSKGGTSEQLSFPAGMASAINAISSGVDVKTKTGTFKLNSSGSASVSCGFKPDFVAISCGTSGMGGSGGSGYTYHAAVGFTFAGKSSKMASIGEGTSNGYDLLYFLFTQSSSGFSVMGKYFDYDYSGGAISTSKSWSYIAVKYTA